MQVKVSTNAASMQLSRTDYYIKFWIKSICTSGGHGRGHRPAIQNLAAARHVPLTVRTRIPDHAATGHPCTEAWFVTNWIKLVCMRKVDTDGPHGL